jgi:hypothetical protein
MEKKPGTDAALDSALDAILAGDPQSLLKAMRIIEEHPRSEELRYLLTSAIETREAIIAAPSDQARVRHLRMIAMACREQGRIQAQARLRHNQRLRRLIFRPVAIAGASMGLLLPGALALASTAQPGDALYPAKLTFENVQLALEPDPTADVLLHLEFAERRVEEIQTLEKNGTAGGPLMAATSSLNSHTRAATQGVSDIRDHGGAAAQLAAPLERHRDSLTELADKNGCDKSSSNAGCGGLQTALASSNTALSKIKDDPAAPAGPTKPDGPVVVAAPASPTPAPAVDPTPEGTTAAPVASTAPSETPGTVAAADPAADPTADPASDPTADPASDPTADPAASPTPDPAASPTPDPADPTADPSVEPTPAESQPTAVEGVQPPPAVIEPH